MIIFISLSIIFLILTVDFFLAILWFEKWLKQKRRKEYEKSNLTKLWKMLRTKMITDHRNACDDFEFEFESFIERYVKPIADVYQLYVKEYYFNFYNKEVEFPERVAHIIFGWKHSPHLTVPRDQRYGDFSIAIENENHERFFNKNDFQFNDEKSKRVVIRIPEILCSHQQTRKEFMSSSRPRLKAGTELVKNAAYKIKDRVNEMQYTHWSEWSDAPQFTGEPRGTKLNNSIQ